MFSSRNKALRMDLSIVIVNWNARDLLRRCLRSALDHARSITSDVWVVDNASADGSADMVAREFPGVRLIRNARNVGYGAATNEGLRAAAGRYVLVANADVEFVNDGLGEMVRFLDANAKVAALGPKLLNADGTLQPSCFSHIDFAAALGIAAGFHNVMPYSWFSRHNPDGGLRRFFHFPDHDRVLYPDWFRAAVVMLRREAMVEAGGYDESFYMYCEEIDLFRRLRKSGWQIAYLPHAEVIHHGEGSSSQVHRSMAVEFWKSLFRISRKFPRESPSVASLWIAMMLGTTIRSFANILQMLLHEPRAAGRFQACGSILEYGLGMGPAGRGRGLCR